MNHLSKFTPAETLMILCEGDPSTKELFKTTLFDLLLKQVLEITIRKQTKLYHEKNREYKYIKVGNNFKTYVSKKHEDFYLSPFFKSNTVKIYNRHIIKMVYENAKSEKYLKNAIIDKPDIKELFNRNLFHKIIGNFPLNEKGKKLDMKFS